jgi:cellulose synthase/poly-beta-1,6-N-acetylglucosamine synthase-like glycosyltransferase
MDEPHSVAVLIPTFQRTEELRRCLAGLRAQSRPADRIIVVVRRDDAATRRMLEQVAADAPVECVLVDTSGQVAALNAGLAVVREDVVAITDDDSVPRPDWLARVMAHFAADQTLGAVGGRDWVHHGDEVLDGTAATVGRLLWYGRFVGFHHLGAGPPREVDTLKGVNMSYRRRALEGLEFDTHLRGGGAQHHNDWAMALAVKRRGWRVLYDPAVAVDHYEADRQADDPRFATDAGVAAERARNQTYVALRYLPLRRALVHVAFVYLVGTTVAPGLGMTIRNLLERRQSPIVSLAEMLRALRARTAGIGAAARVGPLRS